MAVIVEVKKNEGEAPGNKEEAMKKWPQILIAVLCNISTLSFGLQAGWLSPLQCSFQSENSPLDIPPLTYEQISWIGSLPSLALILASPFFGYCLNKYGRKKTCLIATAPNLLHYILLQYASNVYVIYVARLIGGFCSCGGFIMAPIYVSEVTEPHLRGLLGGLTGFAIKVGIILSFVLGGYTSYTSLNFISVSFTVFFMLFYFWLPESPVYLVTINKKEEAKRELNKLRGHNYKFIEKELDQIEQVIFKCNENNKKITLETFFTNRTTVRGLIIICGVYTFQMLCGYPAIVRYTSEIFRNSSSVFSPNLASIMVAVFQLVASFIGAVLVDRIGRKSLLIICTLFMSLTLITFSTYLFARTFFESSSYSSFFKFIPTIALILFISGYAGAYGSVPFVLLPELFSPETRARGSTLSNIWISILEFFVVKIFPSFSNSIGLAPTLLIFAGNCALGTLFYHFFMFETKGLEFGEIYQKLKGKKGRELTNNNEELFKPLKPISDIEK